MLYGNATNESVTIPDEMQATASTASARWRWKAQLSTVVAWMGIAGILLLSSGGVLLWVLLQDPALVTPTDFPSIDMVSVAGARTGRQFSNSRILPADFALSQELAKQSTFGMVHAFQREEAISQRRCVTYIIVFTKYSS